VALKVAQRLDEKIRKVCTTRIFQNANLTRICTEENNWRPNCFVSIHCNGSAAPSASGIETYCYKFGGQGQKLANNLQTELVRILGRSNRGIKEGNFQVLRNTVSPAVLPELGFITNPQDEALMRTTKWQDDAAEALAIGICKFLGLAYNTSPPEQTIHYRVQIGAFSVPANADYMLTRVKRAGFSDAFIKQDGGLYRVQVGAFAVRENAENMLQRVKAAGFSDAFIRQN
jgi:N-acetylmuramoyl-L-alanine amidase